VKGASFGQEGGELSYGSYLRVSELLSLQSLLSKPPAHDELLFIVVHQTYELWFRQLLFELASVRDLSALILVHPDVDGFLNVDCRFWCPADGIEHRSRVDGVPYADWVRDGYLIATPGNVTDYDFIQEEAKAIAERVGVEEIGFDRWNASQLVTNLQSDGASMIAISQTHAGLAAGWRALEKAVLEHKLRHGGHPILRWMAGNVQVETDAAGNQRPSKRLSSERIDGMVGLTMAIGRAIVHMAEAPSTYEERGVLAL